MKQRKITFLFFTLAAFIFAACGGGARMAQEMEMPVSETAFDAAPAYSGEALAFAGNSTAGKQLEAAQERLIIRTADVEIVVTDTEEAMATITTMVVDNGGWVVNSNVFQYSAGAKTGNLTVRVPAAGFDSALEAIRQLAVEVRRVSTTGQDVTEEFVDLSARLANLEATAARVRSFLEETQNVEEALAVNQELSRLESEIESLKGRMQYLSQSAAFSTISINLTPDALSQPLEVGGWRPQGIARDAIQALISTLQALANIFIWLIIFMLPLALLLGIPVWLVVRFLRRRRQARRAPEVTETNAE